MNQREQLNYKNANGLSLADRMKKYEDITRLYLSPKQPVIVRVDGRNFAKYTAQPWVEKPFDTLISSTFMQTMIKVCQEVQNVEFGYHQSDEVSFFLKDYNTIKQGQFFDGNLQKIVSVISSKFTYWFNHIIEAALQEQVISSKVSLKDRIVSFKHAEFDCRASTYPLHEVTNYFIWRQRDAIRNSIQSYAQSKFKSEEELKGRNTAEQLQMIRMAGHTPWEDFPVDIQRGSACKKQTVEVVTELDEDEMRKFMDKNIEIPDSVQRTKWALDTETPIFSEEKDYIDSLVFSTKETVQPSQLEIPFP